MIDCSSYWVASHITGIFQILDESTNPLYKGSRGAGFCIDRGVTTTVKSSPDSNYHIYFNNKEHSISDTKVSNRIIQEFRKREGTDTISINHDFEIPFSAGYGASAAGALGLAFALNDYFAFKLSREEIFQIAHKVEVDLHTGLGDIIGIYNGGLEIRESPGAPGFGKTRSMSNKKSLQIATCSLGKLSTASVLTDPNHRQKIIDHGNNAVNELMKNPDLETFGKLANSFTNNVNLQSEEFKDFYDSIDGPFFKGQIMLGEGIFIIYSEELKLQNIVSEQFKEEKICYETVKRCNNE